MVTFIGVDPAYRSGGFYVCAIFGTVVRFIQMPTVIDFFKFIDQYSEAGEEVYICIENSNETNHTFISKKINKPAVREKMSRDVGKNQAVSQISVDYARERIKFGEVFSVSPAEKGMKWSHQQVKREFSQHNHEVINYKGNVSEQDKRDAYKLALRAKYEYLLHLNKKK